MGLLGSALGSAKNTFLAELAGIYYFLTLISSGGGVIRVSLESFSFMTSKGFRLLSVSKFCVLAGKSCLCELSLSFGLVDLFFGKSRRSFPELLSDGYSLSYFEFNFFMLKLA